MMESINYLARVICMTFNHAPYIVDAMNGFAMQQTTFPFVCIIVDDASTDGEPEVISHYMRENFDLEDKTIAIKEETDDYRLMYARHKSNLNCYFVAVLLKYNHYSINKPQYPYYMRWVGAKYIAMCEGDDYWIDPNKLQKQVEYLEAHKEINICTHNAEILYCATSKIEPFNDGLLTGVYNIKNVIRMRWFTPTASFLYRNNFRTLPVWAKNGCNGDMAILYSNLLKGNLFYDSRIMSVYRYGTPSSLSIQFSRKEIVRRKLNLYKTINQVTHYKYILYTIPQALKLRVMQTSVFKIVNNLRIKIRESIIK